MIGGGAGHIIDMIARMKANEALRKKKSYFKTMQDYLYVTNGQKLSFRQVTKEELEVIRLKIKKKRRIETRNAIIMLCLSLLLTVGIMWFLISGFKALAGY
jgi:hypothetical protein